MIPIGDGNFCLFVIFTSLPKMIETDMIPIGDGNFGAIHFHNIIGIETDMIPIGDGNSCPTFPLKS